MSKLQVARSEAVRTPVRLQVARSEATTPAPSGTHTLVVSEVLALTSSTVPVLASTTGTSMTANPFDRVVMEISVAGAFTSINWSQQATGAPTVELAQSGMQLAFTAPAVLAGADLRFAVTATGPGGTSDPVFFGVVVGPQVLWFLNAAASWAPVVKLTV